MLIKGDISPENSVELPGSLAARPHEKEVLCLVWGSEQMSRDEWLRMGLPVFELVLNTIQQDLEVLVFKTNI